MKSMSMTSNPSGKKKKITTSNRSRPALNNYNYNLIQLIDQADWLDHDSLDLDSLSYDG